MDLLNEASVLANKYVHLFLVLFMQVFHLWRWPVVSQDFKDFVVEKFKPHGQNMDGMAGLSSVVFRFFSGIPLEEKIDHPSLGGFSVCKATFS